MKRTADERRDDSSARHSLELLSPPESRIAPADGGVVDAVAALRWRRARLTAYAAYFVVLAVVVAEFGVPTGRLSLAVIIIAGLLLTSIGRSRRQAVHVVLDWLPFTGVLLLYDGTRGVADALGIGLHQQDILNAEKWLFGGVEPTVWLQHHLYDPAHVYWYDALCTLVYTTHFLATPILAAVLWLRDRTLWIRYISRVVLLAVAGLITYCLFPEAPPWYAAEHGLSPAVGRLSARGWIWLHANNLNEVLANAQKDGANPVAAMPSLHIAFAVLVAIMIGVQLRSRWRWLLALYPAAMGFTLVYCGEHYVLDLLVGAIYAVAVHLALNRWEQRRSRRTGAAAPGTSDLERAEVT